MLVMYYGLTRICLGMARDGLLPHFLAVIHTRTRTPVRIILITGLVIALVAGFLPIHLVAELVNIGTLAAFVFVCIGVIVLRKQHPNLPRPFKLPWNPVIPVLGALTCFYLMIQLPGITWIRFLVWTLTGLVIYYFYGQRYSLLGKKTTEN
jgi:APA family basic amino acid/polyamine antiporter